MDTSSQTCPSCNSQVSLQAQFCAQCGTPLSSNRVINKIETEEKIPTCPYCHGPLKKAPKRKTSCPSCRKPIFIRSRPSDRTPRLVTQEQADDIEHEWAINYELETLLDVDKERFERIRAAQIEKHGSERPEQLHSALHTIRRASYQRQELESIKEGNFAQFRIARLGEALLLEEEVDKDEELLRKTLAVHLELCYIDLNDPQYSTTRERELYNGAPFDPSQGVLATGILNITNGYIERLSLTRAETEALFHQHNGKHLSRLNLPLSIDEGWKKLEPALIFNKE